MARFGIKSVSTVQGLLFLLCIALYWPKCFVPGAATKPASEPTAVLFIKTLFRNSMFVYQEKCRFHIERKNHERRMGGVVAVYLWAHLLTLPHSLIQRFVRLYAAIVMLCRVQ